MFSKITRKFHKSDNLRPKLLHFKEFCKLDTQTQKTYVRGLFHKHQRGAREISQELHQTPTTEVSSSIYSTEPSSSVYSDATPVNSNTIPQHTEEPYYIGNNGTVYIQDEFDVISEEMNTNEWQYLSWDFESQAVTAPSFNIPATPTSTKTFYMDNNHKEEEEITLPTRELKSSLRINTYNASNRPIKMVRFNFPTPDASPTTSSHATSTKNFYMDNRHKEQEEITLAIRPKKSSLRTDTCNACNRPIKTVRFKLPTPPASPVATATTTAPPDAATRFTTSIPTVASLTNVERNIRYEDSLSSALMSALQTIENGRGHGVPRNAFPTRNT
ncbi:uncharacterized protein J8A68_000264 [[Candida] subhashii]|uniref:Uncharacterized protein n=1 Tax=[Candida] subhashii TaxID=561895 RepID=A0A8J5QNA9_9ASCO|nr:uncharacterized protein J8A68_000264 [[Candida] subhashii]KAG7666192.1 hypothetical protein J8A68_000264 [[Candida] subhashii]